MTAGTETTECRSYRFGHVLVDVFPELVLIAVPYGAGHDDFVDASMFVERYTHCADASVVEDDDRELELHIYPNTENLVTGKGPYPLPGPDPRIGHWDEPSRRPVIPTPRAPEPEQRQPVYSLVELVWHTPWYIQDVSVRAGAAVAALACNAHF